MVLLAVSFLVGITCTLPQRFRLLTSTELTVTQNHYMHSNDMNSLKVYFEKQTNSQV